MGDIIEKHGNVTVKVKSRSQNNSHIKGFIKIHGEFMNQLCNKFQYVGQM